jgi:hypothetical protein
MTLYFHAQRNKKLDNVIKYLSERYDSIEFIVEIEDDIVKTSKIHSKNYEALIIVDANNIVQTCSVKYLNKIKDKKCIIL